MTSRTTAASLLCLATVSASLHGGPAPIGATSAEPWRSTGERLYMQGLGTDGTAVPAIVQGDLRVTSTDMPCANCHRRSGWAGAEGTVTVPPVTGAALYAPVTRGRDLMGTLRTEGEGTRPAYDDVTLLRAIRDGIDAAGRTLSPTMPRYALGAADGAALVAHLRALSVEPPLGVTASEVHLATVMTPRTETADRVVMLDVLRAFARDKNAETRRETRRRERGPWDMKQHYDNYRRWVLHEWSLTGAPEEWFAQLAAHYREQPVYALVSGLGDDWTPVHRFAERFRVPVVLPQTPLPVESSVSDGFYTMYYSRGVMLEADTLVGQLAKAQPSQLVQLSRCGTPGEAAARRVRARAPSGVEVVHACIGPSGPIAEHARPPGVRDGATVALWLTRADADALLPDISAWAGPVYLSATLRGAGIPTAVPAPTVTALLLHPFVPPADLERHAWRATTWLAARGLGHSGRREVAVNTLFAASLAAEALTHPRTLDSREYFLERIEHMASRSPSRSAYPEIVFGVQRRFGSAGCYVLQVPTSPELPYSTVAPWSVPSSSRN